MAIRRFAAGVPDRARAYALAGLIENLLEPPPDALTIFEDAKCGWRIEAYFDDTESQREIAAEIAELDPNAPEFACETVPDLNWVALSQAALPPVHAGRFTVHGSHDSHRVPRGPNAILIDAGEAFGTAHHATTSGCLAAIDRLARACTFGKILDLGCGTGVLAIAAAKAMPRAKIIATDMDARSVEVAACNMRVNGLANRIQMLHATGVAHPAIRKCRPFDLVIANILASPLIRLAPSLARTVRRRGTLVLSGILIPQAPEVIAAYCAQGFHLDRHDRITGWSTLTLLRR